MMEQPQKVLLAGASGGLGHALTVELGRRFPGAELLTLSRKSLSLSASRQRHFSVQLSEPASVAQVSDFLREQGAPPDWVINCCGVLHEAQWGPEKSLEQCRADWLQRSISINVLTHLHLAQALAPHLKPRLPLRWASLSAKVGSITDNRLGGWYSYRISKAALNMLVKNLSIEWDWRLQDCCVVAIHPGTTDTALSKPFQKNIAEGKLYSPAISAERIVTVMQGLDHSHNGQLLFWNGSRLPW